MTRYTKFLLFVLALCLISLPSVGSDRNEDMVVSSFNKAATKHKGKFASLMMKHGFRLKERLATAGNILDRLYRYHDDTVLLFYDHDDSNNKLRVWALDNMGRIKLKEITLSKKQLEQKLYGFRKRINTLGFQIDRAPKKRRGYW